MKPPSQTVAAAAQTTQADPRWQAVLTRDARADGQFVFSVATTGVYCRPSCRARQARPEHVAFHASPAEAERRGFRACKRCRPASQPGPDPQTQRVLNCCRAIDKALSMGKAPPTLQRLAEQAGISRFHLQRQFKAVIGISPKAYAATARAQRLRRGLAQKQPVTTALYDAGFGSAGRLYEQSASLLGMTPGQYQQGGAQRAIASAVAPCSLGHVLVAMTDRGVCAVLLGDDPQALQADLRARFPRATLHPDGPTLHNALQQVVELIDHPGKQVQSTLPLDIRGTAFQQRVWAALSTIPPGQTRSYRQIAEDLGQPQASRAVASACGQNHLAVLIPCHRVLRSSGDLAGYRWGLDRKRTLLQREAAAASPPAARNSTAPRSRDR